MAQDYRTRLLADTSKHDKAINKSAQQIYKYKKQTDGAKQAIGGMTAGIGKLAGALGLAYSGMEIFRMAVASSEPATDRFNRNMEAAKASVQAFINSFANGATESCISHLGEIADAARQAYDALDALGTRKLWANVGLASIDAQIAQVRAQIASGDTSQQTKQQLDRLIQQRTGIVEGLGEATEDAIRTGIVRIMSTFNSDLAELMSNLTNEEYKQIEYTLKRITRSPNAAEAIQEYAARYHRQGGTGRMELNPKSGEMQEVWNNESIHRIYTVIANLGNISEQELAPILALLQEQEQRKEQNAQIAARATRMGNRVGGGTAPKAPAYQQGSITDIEHQIQELQNRLRNEVLQGNEAAAIGEQISMLKLKKQAIESLAEPMQHLQDAIEDMPTLDGTLIDGDGIANELQKAIDGIKECGVTIDELEHLQDVGDGIGYIGDMFKSVSEVAGDESGKMLGAIADSVSAIGAAIVKISSLMLAEGAASAMDLPFPANLAALASVVAAVMGVIGSIKSIGAQQFAQGGIVQGQTTIGDHIPAMVNAGEMILNTTQQAKLFKILNTNGITTTQADGGNVTFVIRGSELYGVLQNYEKTRRRVK